MHIAGVEGTSGTQAARTAAAPPDGATADGAFASALGEQTRRAAARDLLAAMPPPLADQIMRPTADGAPPVPGVHEMFVALQDGSFVPGEREMGSRFWRALDAAAKTFESPDEMWSTMRDLLGSRDQIAAAVSAAAGAPDEASAAAPAPETTSDAFAALGGPLPSWQIDWWSWTLEHILGEGPTGS